MAGNDLIGIAKTGSGKTVAFLLPMFRQIMDQRPLDNGEGPIGENCYAIPLDQGFLTFFFQIPTSAT